MLGSMTRARGLQFPGPGKGWVLKSVSSPASAAGPEAVAVFTAQHYGRRTERAGWQIIGELGRQNGRLIVRSFAVQPVDLAEKVAIEALAASRQTGSAVFTDDVAGASSPAGGVTAELLRSIPFGALLADVLIEVGRWEAVYSDVNAGGDEPWLEDARWAKDAARQMAGVERKPGRRPYGDDFYRHVALQCLAIQAERLDQSVIRTLSEREHAEYETARGWVKETRRRGLLAPGSPGRQGFEAGPSLNEQGSTDGT